MALNDMTQEEIDALNQKNQDAARNNQMRLGVSAAKNVVDQAKAANANYLEANEENRELAQDQIDQNRHLTAANSFNALRDLQAAATGVRNSMGQGLNGSGTYNYLDLLSNRADKDAMTYWNELQNNNNQVYNAYKQSVNQNNQAMRDLEANTTRSLADIKDNTVANINNIRSQNAEKYQDWDINAAYDAVTKEFNMGGATLPVFGATQGGQKAAELSGYQPYNKSEADMNINRPDATRYISGQNDYYSQLLNSYNRGYQNKR